jgi:hypothetical protein
MRYMHTSEHDYTSSTGMHKFSKNLGPRRVKSSKSYTEDPQTLGTSIQNLVALATWQQGVCILVLAFAESSVNFPWYNS